MKDIPQCNERKYIMKLTHLGVEENTNVLKHSVHAPVLFLYVQEELW